MDNNEYTQEQIEDFKRRLAEDMAVMAEIESRKAQKELERQKARERIKQKMQDFVPDGMTPEQRLEEYRKRAKEAEKQSGITPLQTTIEFRFDKVNAPNVVKFIKAQNKKRGYELKLPFAAYLPHAKKLISTYGEQVVTEALVEIAKNWAKNPEGKNGYISLEYVESFLKNGKSNNGTR